MVFSTSDIARARTVVYVVVISTIDIAIVDRDCSTKIVTTVVYVVVISASDISIVDIDRSTINASTVVYLVVISSY